MVIKGHIYGFLADILVDTVLCLNPFLSSKNLSRLIPYELSNVIKLL